MRKNKFLVVDFLNEYGNKSFEEFPFCEADIAVIDLLIYSDFEATDILKSLNTFNVKVPISLLFGEERMKILSRRYMAGADNYYKFIETLSNSKRYYQLMFSRIRYLYDPERSVQFFAYVTYLDHKKFIVFRGTDNTIAGWKEDLLTAIKDEVIAQKLAVEYVKDVLATEKDNFYIVGHSKGGNLSYYSFFNLTEKEKKRIIKVYNLDGNGFKNDHFEYDKYKDQIIKIVPHDDVVGLIFDLNSPKTIVETLNFGVMAHDMMSWNMDKESGNFIRRDEFKVASLAFGMATDGWLKHTLSKDQSVDFLNLIFAIVDCGEPKVASDLLFNLSKNIDKYKKTIKNYPEKKKEMISNMGKKYIDDFVKIYTSLRFKGER